ncbi:ATP-binding cassette domain-containing protein, partial [Nocardia sp. NPDC056611]|uniref:ATP-binding cassette domain-containing protein n=1 Tax=Nocardia sp. NPDC056611 TaxID=3345877 RepID=UPI003672202D
MTDPVLNVNDVTVVRSGNPILQGVSLTVRAGEHWALLGPNGAGKTTLLRMLGAFEHPTGGTVEVLGRRLGRVDMRALRAEIGHVDPRHVPSGDLTVREVVLTGATNTVALIPRRGGAPPPHRQAGPPHEHNGRGPTPPPPQPKN